MKRQTVFKSLIVLLSMMLFLNASYADDELTARISNALSPDTPDSVKIDTLLTIAVEQQRELEIQDAQIERWEKLYQINKRPWYEAVWDSDITKVVIFVAGVELGRRMVLVR